MHLSLLLDMAADGFGDRVVIGPCSTGLTASRLRTLSHAAARAIRSRNADSVLYLGVNGPSFAIAMFGAALAGVPLVPVNYRLGREQMDHLLAQHPAAYGIASTQDEVDALWRNGIGATAPEALLDEPAETEAGDVELAAGDAPAVIIYTSGTTSAPKAVLLRHENLVSYVLGTVEFACAGEEEAALMSVPPYHIAAVANVLTNLYAGRRTLMLQQFSPVEWMGVVRSEGVTNAMVVPTMLARILQEPSLSPLPSLRTLAYGGAPMPGKVIERALMLWPNVDFVNAYGLTETSSTISILGPDEHRAALLSDDPAVRARLSSAGQVLPTIELEIRDIAGAVLGAGEAGRIWVRGDQVSAEDGGLGKALDSNGFFDTRDEGYLDSEGFLFIGGRSDDTIIRGGENIAPAEIEEVLLRHEAVADVVVIGVADEEWGHRIEAAVVLHEGTSVTEEELRHQVRVALRGSKTPDRIVFWTEIPRTETGKLVRRQAVERLAQALSSAAGAKGK